MKFTGGVIDEAAVKAAGGQVLEGGSGVRVGGWTITSHKGPITADAELDRIKAELHTLAAPEQFYGSNTLRLMHEASGTTISFSALDALKGWLADTSEPVHVGESEEWLRARQQDVEAHAAHKLQYDWTYTTSYTGTVSPSASTSGGGSSGSGYGDHTQKQQQGQGQQQEGQPEPQASASAAAAGAPQWEPSSEQIPRALLTARDPILLYDELPLYESELDDHGSSRVTVKLRVMPRCWYVLLRFWLRVDHVLLRLRETRLFCQFDPNGGAAATVLREVRHHQGSFAELQAAGAPAEGPAYADADTAAQALMAVAPVGVAHYRLERLML